MIPAVILAAGLSSRMGRTKALLPLGPSDTFLSRIVKTFRSAGIDDVVVVLGHDGQTIAAAVRAAGLNVRIAMNDDYQSGQFSSVLRGLDAVDQPDVEAVLMTLVDVPFVGVETVRAVIERYRQSAAPIVRPVRGEQHGHPVLVDRTLVPELRASDPSLGMKPVVRAHASPAGDVGVDDDGAFWDIDTPDEYARALGH